MDGYEFSKVLLPENKCSCPLSFVVERNEIPQNARDKDEYTEKERTV